MKIKHDITTCRWAEPTLYMPAPLWLDADDRPWSCLRGSGPRPIESTLECLSCPRWEARGDAAPDHSRRAASPPILRGV